MKIDYHEFTLEAAMAHAEGVIGNIRIRNRTEQVEFITGHGVIRNNLIVLLRGYGLDPAIKLGNAGCVICEIS